MTQDQTQLWEAVKDISEGMNPASPGTPFTQWDVLTILAEAIMTLRKEPVPETSAGSRVSDCPTCPEWWRTSQLIHTQEMTGEYTVHHRSCPHSPHYQPAETAASATSLPDTTGPTMRPCPSCGASLEVILMLPVQMDRI